LTEIFPPKIDWRQILSDLRDHGCTGYRVAIALGTGWSTVQRWGEGAEPGYGYGRALLRLHAAYCGAAMTLKRQIEGENAA
jgi:hypothetical protein